MTRPGCCGGSAGRWRECGLNVRAARVETLGAEVVDVFYVTEEDGAPLTDRDRRRATVQSVLAALAG